MTGNKVLTKAGLIISLHVEKSTGIYKRHLLTVVHVFRQPGLDPHITSNLSIEFSMFLWSITSYLIKQVIPSVDPLGPILVPKPDNNIIISDPLAFIN